MTFAPDASTGQESKPRATGVRRPSLRAEQKQITRDRLLAATVEVVERDGYLAATVDAIAAAAGVGRATFYLHFESKPAVVRELIATFARRDEIWRSLGALSHPTRDDVRTWLEQVVRLYDEERGYFLTVEQAAAVEPELAEIYYRTSEPYADVAARVLSGPREDVQVRAMLLWLQLGHLCFVWRVRGMQLDEELVMETLTDIWTAALS